jgi:hypothetical protein
MYRSILQYLPPETSTTNPLSSYSSSSISVYGTSLSHSMPPCSSGQKKRLLNATMEYINSIASKYIEELAGKEALATTACEIILQMRDSGHGLTPTGVYLGLL